MTTLHDIEMGDLPPGRIIRVEFVAIYNCRNDGQALGRGMVTMMDRLQMMMANPECKGESSQPSTPSSSCAPRAPRHKLRKLPSTGATCPVPTSPITSGC